MDQHNPIKRRIKRKKGFYKHLASFLGVNIGLMLLNLSTGGGWWFQYTTISWGMGLLIHYFMVFGLPKIGPFDEVWEEKAYHRELNKLNSQPDPIHLPDEELDLDEIPELRNEWKDSDLV